MSGPAAPGATPAATTTPGPPSVASVLGRRRLGTRAFLAAVWVMLWRDLSIGNIVVGLLLAGVIMAVIPFPATAFGLRLRPWPFILLVTRFLGDVVKASLQVAYQSVAPWKCPAGRFVQVQLRATGDLPRTLTAELTSLVPGSLVVGLDPDAGRLTLHVFDAPTSAHAEAAVARVLDQERRLMRALFAEEAS